jgi:hypothetical protein
MKTRTLITFVAGLLSIAVALLVAGCGGPVIGSGDLTTKEYDFKDFTRIEVSHAFEVQITRGESFKVEVTTDDNLVDRLRVEQSGSTLRIGMESGISFGTATREAMITLPTLEAVQLSGASKGGVIGFGGKGDLSIGLSGASTLALTGIKAGDARLEVSGASKLAGDLDAGDVGMEASGASQIQLSGSGDDAALEASGASKLSLTSFELAEASVTLSGASTATVNVSRTLDADLSGASNLTYSGGASVRNIQTSGASQINHRD